MDQIKTLVDTWPVVLSLVGVIVWLVRLEGRVSQGDRDQALTEKTIEVLSAKHDALDSKVIEQLAEVRESLARIEGHMGIAKL